LELSCKCEYALLALLELTQHYSAQSHSAQHPSAQHPSVGQVLQIKEIAAQQSIPDRYLEQLLATLRRQGLVKSQRGAKGGYLLARPPWQITVLDVMQAIEGEDVLASHRRASEGPPTPEQETLWAMWQEVQALVIAQLQKTSLQDLYDQQAQRSRGAIMYYI
jgi:Rrf2 family cysteine metabolism transcriptional repressor